MAQMNLHGPQSQQISNNVIPQLEQQVMASNGGPIHGVSGATYTSQAFGSSLQAALSQLKGGANAQLAAAGNGNGGLVQSQGGRTTTEPGEAQAERERIDEAWSAPRPSCSGSTTCSAPGSRRAR